MTLTNHYIIRPDSVHKETVGGFEVPNAWFHEREETEYARKNLRGIIVAEPNGFTNQNFMPMDEGIPRPMCYVGHDHIQEMVNKGYDWDNRRYHSTPNESLSWMTYADYGKRLNGKVGEVCYFHPGVTEKENLLSDGTYKVGPNDLICVIRDGVPVPQGFWVLVEKEEQEEQYAGDLLIAEKQMILKQGTVVYGSTPGPVYFQEDSEWKLTIEGHEYLVMLEENILGRR